MNNSEVAGFLLNVRHETLSLLFESIELPLLGLSGLFEMPFSLSLGLLGVVQVHLKLSLSLFSDLVEVLLGGGPWKPSA